MPTIELNDAELAIVTAALWAVVPSGGGSPQYTLLRKVSGDRDINRVCGYAEIASRELYGDDAIERMLAVEKDLAEPRVVTDAMVEAVMDNHDHKTLACHLLNTMPRDAFDAIAEGVAEEVFDNAKETLRDVIWDGDIGAMMVDAAMAAGVIGADASDDDRCRGQLVMMRRVLSALIDDMAPGTNA